jgi:hypothetical protein
MSVRNVGCCAEIGAVAVIAKSARRPPALVIG